MKHTIFKHLLTVLMVSVIISSCNQASKTSEKETTTTEKDNGTLKHDDQSKATKDNTITSQPAIGKPASGDLDFLKTLNGKYPNDAKLFDNTAFTDRLKKLLGDRYNFLKETWAVETPMEYSNDIFTASACQAHNCGATNFIIVYDFLKNVMYAGIREEGKIKTVAEDGGTNPKITEWEKDN